MLIYALIHSFIRIILVSNYRAPSARKVVPRSTFQYNIIDRSLTVGAKQTGHAERVYRLFTFRYGGSPQAQARHCQPISFLANHEPHEPSCALSGHGVVERKKKHLWGGGSMKTCSADARLSRQKAVPGRNRKSFEPDGSISRR